jgi:hypothetical protein
MFEHYRRDYNDAFPEWPLDPGVADYRRFPATGSPYTDTANWNGLTSADKEIINRILVNYGKAIEAYLRRLVSRNAPFDRYVAGQRNAISRDAKAGLKLFIGKAECVHCHYTPLPLGTGSGLTQREGQEENADFEEATRPSEPCSTGYRTRTRACACRRRSPGRAPTAGSGSNGGW